MHGANMNICEIVRKVIAPIQFECVNLDLL